MAILKFKTGSMNSTKSADLIMQVYRLRSNGKQVLTYKPALDDRDSGVIRSRAVPTALPADLVVTPDCEGKMFNKAMQGQPQVIYVDEVQFLTPAQIEELVTIVDVLSIDVICYGLLTDFKAVQFAGSKRLIELADVVEWLTSECTICSNTGIINARFVNDQLVLEGEQIQTGAEEAYRVLCRRCFYEHGGLA